MRIRTRYASAEELLERYGRNISRGGMFLETPRPHAVGTRVRVELLLRDGVRLLRGEARVVRVREEGSPGKPPGISLRFVQLDRPGRELMERAVQHRNELARASEQEQTAPAWNEEAAGRLPPEPDDSFHAELDALFHAYLNPPGEAGTKLVSLPGKAPIELSSGDLEILEVDGSGESDDADTELDFDFELEGSEPADRAVSPSESADDETRRLSITDAALLMEIMVAAEEPDPADSDPDRTRKVDPETAARLRAATASPDGRAPAAGARRSRKPRVDPARIEAKLLELEKRLGPAGLAAAAAEARLLLAEIAAQRSRYRAAGEPAAERVGPIDPKVARAFMRRLRSG